MLITRIAYFTLPHSFAMLVVLGRTVVPAYNLLFIFFPTENRTRMFKKSTIYDRNNSQVRKALSSGKAAGPDGNGIAEELAEEFTVEA